MNMQMRCQSGGILATYDTHFNDVDASPGLQRLDRRHDSRISLEQGRPGYDDRNSISDRYREHEPRLTSGINAGTATDRSSLTGAPRPNCGTTSTEVRQLHRFAFQWQGDKICVNADYSFLKLEIKVKILSFNLQNLQNVRDSYFKILNI